MYTAEDQNIECPLCMEPLEMDDINFFPCTCGYQICRFCWHRIRTDENGLCPACRKQYPEDPADFTPVSVEELHRIKNEKRQKDQQRKQKLSENRKHLANVRVVQKNLVFVVGLPPRLADADTLKKQDCFGKYGKIHKVVVNQSTSYAGLQGPSASAYVTYYRAEDALRAIQAVSNVKVDGRTLKASLGTTKYCNYFLRGQQCPKTDCMYLHELGDQAASFTKEEMQHGKHQDYERKLHDQMLGSNNNGTAAPPPAAAVVPVAAAVPSVAAPTTTTKKSGKQRKPGLAPRHARQGELKAAAEAAAAAAAAAAPLPQDSRSSPEDPSPTFPSPTFPSLTPPSPEAQRSGVEDDPVVDDCIATGTAHEDDLGFDPWDECSKGLADLLEKEAVAAPPLPAPSLPRVTVPPTALHRPPFLPRSLPPFEPTLLRRAPPPPPGFAPFYLPAQQQPQQKLCAMGQHQPQLHHHHQNSSGLAELYALRESQETLRSLLPTVNITFGPPLMQGPPPLPPVRPWAHHHSASSAPDMPWIAQDPAILTGGTLSEAGNMAARF